MREWLFVSLCWVSLKGWTSAIGRVGFSWSGATFLFSKVTFIEGLERKDCFPLFDVEAMQDDIRR
jgi:hypothetical protein